MCFKYYCFIEKLLTFKSMFIANKASKINILINISMFSILAVYFINKLPMLK